jgi:cell division protein FtsI/penicillin-binding protein 2
MIYKSNYSAKWRKYQARLQRTARRNRFLRKLPLLFALTVGTLAIFVFVFSARSWFFVAFSQTSQKPSVPEKPKEAPSDKFSQEDLAEFLKDVINDSSALVDQWMVEKKGSRLTIQTTIDAKLQNHIVRRLRRARTLQSAVVVLNPYDGRILALASRDMHNPTEDLCLKAAFPAASLFKIISAAAALETAGYTPDKRISFVGSEHTLYKYQLKAHARRSSRQTIFRKAFAASNNSVFGKLGIYDLGQNTLNEYADKFLFNRPIPFDFPIAMSTIDVPTNDFGLAEISSGFNKRTLISPLHAALLAAVVANQGEMAAPWLVDTIYDDTDGILYHARCRMLPPPISKKTSEELKVLMQESVIYGTSRTAFRKLRRNGKFKHLDLGAKTGTINDKMDRFKYDWITTYALTPDGANGICISVLGVHGKKLGVRSVELARAIISYYFSSS